MRTASGQFRKGYRANPKNEFKPGMEPWNKGKHHSPPGSERGHFKKGNLGPATKPPGTVTRNINKGKPEYTINIDWRGNRKPHNSYKWYLWEVEHQEDRPEGMVLYLKNGDPDDVRVENMEVITRGELARRNRRNSHPQMFYHGSST